MQFGAPGEPETVPVGHFTQLPIPCHSFSVCKCGRDGDGVCMEAGRFDYKYLKFGNRDLIDPKPRPQIVTEKPTCLPS